MKHHTTRALAVTLLLATILCTACSHKAEPASQQTVSAAQDSVLIELVADGSLNALQLLQRGHAVEARGSAMGSFVTAVDSVEGGTGCFWVYSVNDTTPKVAADRFVPNAGDTVRWHFRRGSN
jgi:hypothetical protein